jgi:hypothetical protein
VEQQSSATFSTTTLNVMPAAAAAAAAASAQAINSGNKHPSSPNLVLQHVLNVLSHLRVAVLVHHL